MYLILFAVFIIGVINILLTDKTSPLYVPTIGKGIIVGMNDENRQRYQNQYSSMKEAEKSAVFLMTLYGEEGTFPLRIYREFSGDIVLVDVKNELALKSPFFFEKQAVNSSYYTYHPSETVYTGATVGGIHTGGVHKTEAYYTQGARRSGNAKVYCYYAKDCSPFFIERIKLNGELLKKARQNDDICELLSSGYLYLIEKSDSKSQIYMNAALRTSDMYQAEALKSSAIASFYLREYICEKVIVWLTEECKRREVSN